MNKLEATVAAIAARIAAVQMGSGTIRPFLEIASCNLKSFQELCFWGNCGNYPSFSQIEVYSWRKMKLWSCGVELSPKCPVKSTLAFKDH